MKASVRKILSRIEDKKNRCDCQTESCDFAHTQTRTHTTRVYIGKKTRKKKNERKEPLYIYIDSMYR